MERFFPPEQWRITFMCSRRASEASMCPKFRCGARAFLSFPARIRTSEQMKRSGMVRERNERPSTAGEAEERSGYMELYAVPGGTQRPSTFAHSIGNSARVP